MLGHHLHLYAFILPLGLSSYDHAACETEIQLQSLFRCPVYTVPLDEWCIITGHWSAHTMWSLCLVHFTLHTVEPTCISMHGQGHSNCTTSTYPLLQQHQYQYINFCGAMIICSSKGTIWDISGPVLHPKCELGRHATWPNASTGTPSQRPYV